MKHTKRETRPHTRGRVSLSASPYPWIVATSFIAAGFFDDK